MEAHIARCKRNPIFLPNNYSFFFLANNLLIDDYLDVSTDSETTDSAYSMDWFSYDESDALADTFAETFETTEEKEELEDNSPFGIEKSHLSLGISVTLLFLGPYDELDEREKFFLWMLTDVISGTPRAEAVKWFAAFNNPLLSDFPKSPNAWLALQKRLADKLGIPVLQRKQISFCDQHEDKCTISSGCVGTLLNL